MKELSIEEKAKAYDEAIEKLHEIITMDNKPVNPKEIGEYLFPELKESEDNKGQVEDIENIIKRWNAQKYDKEAIRDCIGVILTDAPEQRFVDFNTSLKDCLAWLEKQGNLMKALQISNARIGELIEKNYYLREQLENQGENTYNKVLSELLHKVICTFINDPDIPYFDREKVSMEVLPYVERLEKQGEQEPKFRIGDTIKKKSTGDIVTVSEVDLKNREYRLSNTSFIPFKYEYLWELVEQKPVFEMITPEESLGIDSDTYNKIVDECIYCEQKPADKVGPKFKVGDWVFIENIEGYKQGPFRIKSVYKFGYNSDEYSTIPFTYEELLSKWTIADAKDGDVLVNKYGAIFINAGSSNGGTLDCYCYLSVKNKFCIEKHKTGSWLYKDEIKPATKEQRDILMKAMADAGYTFDFDKKELKKIIDESQIKKNLQNNNFRRMFEQKSAWSEEDEMFVHGLIRGLAAKRDIHGHTTFSSDCIDITETINWLKSLKERYTWKPSEEQLKSLQKVIDVGYFTSYPNSLETLYEQLKQL